MLLTSLEENGLYMIESTEILKPTIIILIPLFETCSSFSALSLTFQASYRVGNTPINIPAITIPIPTVPYSEKNATNNPKTHMAVANVPILLTTFDILKSSTVN